MTHRSWLQTLRAKNRRCPIIGVCGDEIRSFIERIEETLPETRKVSHA